MNISSVGLDQGGDASGRHSSLRQAYQDFDQLFQPLQNGNLRYLVPRCAGVSYSQLRREDLWDKYYTDAPAQQRQCVERHNIVKRA